MDIIEDIQYLDIKTLPNSFVCMCVARRRGGKTTLVEDMIIKLREAKKLDMCFLFSGTDAGFNMIKGDKFRKTDIEDLKPILNNYEVMNEYNKIADPPNKFKLKTLIVIDDLVLKLKNKNFSEILSNICVNGRHISYKPLSLSFIIIGQNLTSFPRVVRNNVDLCLFNNISSQKELEYLLDENFYLLDSSTKGKQRGRKLYNDLVISEPFCFICIESYQQNLRNFKDYIKKYAVKM